MLQHQNLKFSYHTFAIQICLVGPICTSERSVYDNEDEKWFKKKKNPTAKLSYKSFWARQASAQKLLIDFSSRNYQQFCICVSVISSFITFSKDKSHLTALLFSCAHIFLPFNKAELKLEIGRHFLSNSPYCVMLSKQQRQNHRDVLALINTAGLIFLCFFKSIVKIMCWKQSWCHPLNS